MNRHNRELSMSLFDDVDLAPDDPILSLPIAFAKESNPNKVNLGVGSYKTGEGHSLLLDSVRKAEKRMAKERSPRDYLPMDGDPEFIAYGLDLIFGDQGKAEGTIERIIGLQTIGCTGALSIAGAFFKELGISKIYLSNPTWPNHFAIFSRCGLETDTYPYYNAETHAIDFEGMKAAIAKMPPKTVIVLQASCHNPTGFDLSQDQWKEICALIKKQGVFPFFDFAYHGFGTNLKDDSWAVCYFLEQGLEFLTSYSFSKNFGLYGERVGLLAGVFNTQEAGVNVRSHLKKIIRGQYSNPPAHGAWVVSTILGDKKLKKLWEEELAHMRSRIKEMREAFCQRISEKDKEVDFSFLTHQKGLFSFIGLTEAQAKRLKEEYAIYLPTNGRINIAGINRRNLDYVIDSILAVMHSPGKRLTTLPASRL